MEHTDVHRVEVSSLLSVSRARDWVYTVHVYTCAVYSGHGMRVYSYKCHRDHHLSHKSRKILIIHYWHQGVTNKMQHMWSLADRRHEHIIMSGDVTTLHWLHDADLSPAHRAPVIRPCHSVTCLRYWLAMECVDKRTSPQECPGSSQTEQNTLNAVQSFLCIKYKWLFLQF